MAVELPGLGSILQLSISSVYTTIPGVSQLSWPGFEYATRETTKLSSTSREFRPAIVDFGEINATLFYDPNDSTHQTLIGKMTSVAPDSSTDQWKLIYNDTNATPANVVFTGYLTAFSLSGLEIEGSLEAEMTIKVTGTVTRNAGA